MGDYQGRRWDGLPHHLALSMVAYSFLMLHSSVTTGAGSSSKEVFPPLGQAHDASGDLQSGALVWLLEDLVLWLIETDRIKSFRPRRN